MSDILNSYVCTNPFSYLEIHKDNVYVCCPSWLNTPVGKTSELEKVWNGNIIKDIQNSVLDGTYRYCSENNCPYLSELIHNGKDDNIFIKKENLQSLSKYEDGPYRISFCFDSSCNLACPSCRSSYIIDNDESQIKINKIMNDIVRLFGKNTRSISMSGTSDPFVSIVCKDLMINFDKSKFPNLSGVYLQTNGLLLTKNMWKRINKIHKMIYTIGISIDAATEKTYSIVRKGGNWNVLLNNLEFIKTIKKKKQFNFIVQDINYKEMILFYDFIMKLNPIEPFGIYFSKINDWSVMNKEVYDQKEIWNEGHPDFTLFLIELKKIVNKHNVTTNMNDIIEKYSLKSQSRLI